MIVRNTTKAWQERARKRDQSRTAEILKLVSALSFTRKKKIKTDWENIWQNARCKGLTPAQSSFTFKRVHNLLPNNSKRFKFCLRETNICTFCTQKDNKAHLWFCTQATGLGIVIREILEKHSVQNQEAPWDSLCRLEVDLP